MCSDEQFPFIWARSRGRHSYWGKLTGSSLSKGHLFDLLHGLLPWDALPEPQKHPLTSQTHHPDRMCRKPPDTTSKAPPPFSITCHLPPGAPAFHLTQHLIGLSASLQSLFFSLPFLFPLPLPSFISHNLLPGLLQILCLHPSFLCLLCTQV